jgi:hypothetical protein
LSTAGGNGKGIKELGIAVFDLFVHGKVPDDLFGEEPTASSSSSSAACGDDCPLCAGSGEVVRKAAGGAKVNVACPNSSKGA